MDIEQKIKIFETSCKKLLGKESAELNQAIDTDIEQQIKDELEEYQTKEEFAYNKKMEKLEKDFNKQLYTLELESKKEILKQKKLIQKDLKNEMIEILKNFTKTPEYESFLENRIQEAIAKIEDSSHAILYFVPADYEKYGKKIADKYQIEVEQVEEKYIGGCLLEDKKQGIYVDNTLQTSLEENLEF